MRAGCRCVAEVRDLESGASPFPRSAYDVIVVVHYLHRPLFPALIEALAPGGLLVYETFTRAQAARGKPTNPDFLLESGELLDLVRPLEVLASREGDYDGRMVASVIARRGSVPDRGFDRAARHAEVRRAPHDAALADEERLRRLVPNAESSGDRGGQLAMRLHGDHRVARRQALIVEVIDQLVERLEARAARDAVLEEEQRPIARLGQQRVELVDALQMREVWMHPG